MAAKSKLAIISTRFSVVLGFSLFFLIIKGCKIENTSSIPQIWFKNFVVIDTVDALSNPVRLGILTFDFADGDGDFGLPEPNENDPPEMQHNLFLKGFYMANGQPIAMPDEEPISTFQFRIPRIDEYVYGKPYEGTIKAELIFYLIPYNSIKYQFYITDRAGNQSNTEQTQVLEVN